MKAGRLACYVVHAVYISDASFVQRICLPVS